MSTHTPGPWQCRPLQGRSVMADATTFEIGSLGADMTAGDATANARLIAAAPDLLTALREMRELEEMHREGGSGFALSAAGVRVRERCDLAIAKAEGR